MYHIRKAISFCGFLIDGSGIRPLVDSVAVIGKMTRPTNVKEIQSFLGSLKYFRQFIESFAKISSPLSDLTTKDTVWLWSAAHDWAFEELKRRLTTAPMFVKICEKIQAFFGWTHGCRLSISARRETFRGDRADGWLHAKFSTPKSIISQGQATTWRTTCHDC